jgi:DNA replication protein DnaC
MITGQEQMEQKIVSYLEANKNLVCDFCGLPAEPIYPNTVENSIVTICEKVFYEISVYGIKIGVDGHEQCFATAEMNYKKSREDEERALQNEKLAGAMRELLNKLPHEDSGKVEIESFNVTQENEESFLMADAWRPEDEFGLLFSGSSGTGKSHLMIGIAKRLVRAGYGVEFVQASDLFIECTNNEFKGPSKYLFAQVLFLDDLGSENISDMRREWLFYLFEKRKNRNKTTFISTNLSIKDMREKFFERIASRIFELTIPVIVNGKDQRLERLKIRMASFKERALEKKQENQSPTNQF